MKKPLQKIIAGSGYCSRRQAEALIKAGKVRLNKQIAEPGMRADEQDEILINNKKLDLQTNKIYIKLNKPKGYTCTNKKFTAEENIFSLVGIKEKIFSVGRLDKNSRGLIILTNDGELTQILSHPSFEHEKEYLVETKETPEKTKEIIKKFLKGIKDEGELLKAKECEYLGGKKFKIILTQGKKRQIRRMFRAVGLEINDLLRTRVGNLKIKELPEGEWKYLKKEEIKKLCDQPKNKTPKK